MNEDSCKNLKIDIGLLAVALITCVFGILSLYRCWSLLSYIAIACIDLYLIAILVTAAVRADSKPRGCPAQKTYEFEWKAEWLFPSRRMGVAVIPLMAVALIISFAGLYWAMPEECFKGLLKETNDALYFSTVTLTTVGYGDIAPLGSSAREWVMFEIGNGFLVLITAFPLLISRVSTF